MASLSEISMGTYTDSRMASHMGFFNRVRSPKILFNIFFNTLEYYSFIADLENGDNGFFR